MASRATRMQARLARLADAQAQRGAGRWLRVLGGGGRRPDTLEALLEAANCLLNLGAAVALRLWHPKHLAALGKKGVVVALDCARVFECFEVGRVEAELLHAD